MLRSLSATPEAVAGLLIHEAEAGRSASTLGQHCAAIRYTHTPASLPACQPDATDDGRAGSKQGHPTMDRHDIKSAHWDHDTGNNADSNLTAFCQRCHINHDWPEHHHRRCRTLFRRRAMRDLFRGIYPFL
ncbi:hypothetical protein [Methylobacterium sp. WL116]|uniref:hypothetical protein n=1 Tax=Methylobacterium sp. WL116 TaxID=2603889 RepID=UPI00164F13CF|nr:hypothetical protein [Methylobacterium sp. WL116]